MWIFFLWIFRFIIFLGPLVWKLTKRFSGWFMVAFLALWKRFKGLFGFGAVIAGSAASTGSKVLVGLYGLQGAFWFIGILITIFLAAYGSDFLGYLLDVSGIQGFIDMLINPIKKIGPAVDDIGHLTSTAGSGSFPSVASAFGAVSFGSILSYFSFLKFIDLALAAVFGFVYLKLNILLYQAYLKRIGLPTKSSRGVL